MSRALIALATVISLGGCSQFRQETANYPCDDCLPPPVAGRYCYHRHLDNRLTTCTAQRCAKRDLKQIDDECDGLTRDFKDGYTQAYIDLAVGRPACVPAVPPQKYWHAWHRSCAGRDGVEEWYAGYRIGLDHGMNSGVSRFNRIVPNDDPCCVSAAYISPYSIETPPNVVRPLGGQTITRQTPPEGAAAVANDGPAPQTPAEPNGTLPVDLTSGPSDAPIYR